jgi:predicted metal-dependent hydrolase
MQKVSIVRSARKTVSIEIHPNGEVVVRAPRRLPRAAIDALLGEKQDWIQRKLAQLEAARPPAPKTFASGETFLYRGEDCPLQISERKRPPLALEQGRFLLSRAALGRAEAVFTAWYQAEARCLFSPRLEELAAQTGLRPARLRLSSARTRWGSCTSAGVVALSWRLVMAPPAVLDYVILHELAHLKIKNHQPAFWSLVESLMPDYAKHRKWLKDNGGRLVIS